MAEIAYERLPDLRSVHELLELMEKIATECGTCVDARRASGLFEEAYRLAVEIRVPRMPDTDDEFARMLDESRTGATFTTDEVFAHLETSRARSEMQRARYRGHLASGRTVDAARMLVTGADCMLSWTHDVTIAVGAKNECRDAIASSLNKAARCDGIDEGLAMLGSIMRLHHRREAWMR